MPGEGAILSAGAASGRIEQTIAGTKITYGREMKMKTGKRIIALLCSVLLLALLVFTNSPGLAEEVPELNWADLVTEEAEAQGTFQRIEIPNLPSIRLWIPAEMISVDISFMEGPFKPAGFFGTEDQSRCVILFVSEAASLEDYASLMEKEGGGSNFRNISINGVECTSYEVERDNLFSLIYPVSDHMVLSVNCMPLDADENWEATRNLILSSIQPAE